MIKGLETKNKIPWESIQTEMTKLDGKENLYLIRFGTRYAPTAPGNAAYVQVTSPIVLPQKKMILRKIKTLSWQVIFATPNFRTELAHMLIISSPTSADQIPVTVGGTSPAGTLTMLVGDQNLLQVVKQIGQDNWEETHPYKFTNVGFTYEMYALTNYAYANGDFIYHTCEMLLETVT